MLLMFVVHMIDLLVRAVRLMASGTAAGYLLMAAVLILFVCGTVGLVAAGAWILGATESRYHWMDSVLPCALGGSCQAQ